MLFAAAIVLASSAASSLYDGTKTSTCGKLVCVAARDGRGGKGIATTKRLSAPIMTLYISARYNRNPGMKFSGWFSGGSVLVVRQKTYRRTMELPKASATRRHLPSPCMNL